MIGNIWRVYTNFVGTVYLYMIIKKWVEDQTKEQ